MADFQEQIVGIGEWEPVQRSRTDLVKRVVDQLQEKILGGAFEQNGSLPAESTLAEYLGVSRPVVREAMSVGLGSTSVRLDDGVRTTNFGPPWMSGTAVSSGFIAALALPNLLAAVDRGRTRRTVSDLRAIAEACEGFSSDSRSYPGPTDGWVPVERIATYLEPVYIGRLPRTDGWENPILYWSDGGSYRVLSMGRDGQIDRDWTRQVDPVASAGHDADIVFGDGRLLAWPSGMDAD